MKAVFSSEAAFSSFLGELLGPLSGGATSLLYGPLVSLKALASAHPEPSQPQHQCHTSKAP